MPKAILKFDLPEERAEFKDAIEGAAMRSILWDMDQGLRERIKREDLPSEQREMLEWAREHLRELCDYNNVEIDT